MATETSARSAANISHTLRGSNFPLDKQGLLDQARQNNADENTMNVLQGLPDRQYGSMADVEKGLGQAT